jgi:glycosyltransferase involved in cell wall biosynthesis
MTDPADSRAPDHVLDIVIPAYNEERGLADCIRRLREYVCTSVPYSTRITVADKASTDDTLKVAHRLADEPADVEVIHIDVKGRGAALQTAWAKASADVVAYMDVDLSTELSALMPLVAPVISGHSDLAIGSRLAPSSRVVRSAKREFVSRGYHVLLRAAFGARFSDAQCGFKAVRAADSRPSAPARPAAPRGVNSLRYRKVMSFSPAGAFFASVSSDFSPVRPPLVHLWASRSRSAAGRRSLRSGESHKSIV